MRRSRSRAQGPSAAAPAAGRAVAIAGAGSSGVRALMATIVRAGSCSLRASMAMIGAGSSGLRASMAMIGAGSSGLRTLLRAAAVAGAGLALFSLGACATRAAPAECTLQTPLVPGVPGSPGHLIPSEINPNGASELAVLMRRFVSDWRAVQTGLRDHQPLPKGPRFPVHARLRCSWPTEPADRNEAFDGFAQAYLGAVKAFDQKPSAAALNQVVASCRACHESTCSGPLVVIDSLRLPEQK
jgi:hypothetical protein